MNRLLFIGLFAGAVLLGAGAGAIATASSTSASAATQGGVGAIGTIQLANSSTDGSAPWGKGPDGDGRGMGPGGPADRAEDLGIVATALGISTSELETQLQAGKSFADVAKAEGVDLQKVIDALVADKLEEIDAALKDGSITQAQHDQMTSNVTRFVTDQVNRAGGMGPGRHGPDGDGQGCDDHDGDGPGMGPRGSGPHGPNDSAPNGNGTNG